MSYSHIAGKIQKKLGQKCFKLPNPTELSYLIKLNLPADVFDFYSCYSPIKTIEINNIRLLPVSEIIEENTNYTPGYILAPLGFCIVANTIEGDVYCIRKNTEGYFIVIASHDEIYEEQTPEEVLNATRRVAQTFQEFLSSFLEQKLKASFYDFEN